MRIRTATATDAAAVAVLWTAGYTNRGPGGRRTPYAERDFFDSARAAEVYAVDSAPGVGGAATDDRDRAGPLGVVVFHPPGAAAAVGRAGEAELSRLVVAERARGHGIGRALVERCLARAQEVEAERLVLWSRPLPDGRPRPLPVARLPAGSRAGLERRGWRAPGLRQGERVALRSRLSRLLHLSHGPRAR